MWSWTASVLVILITSGLLFAEPHFRPFMYGSMLAKHGEKFVARYRTFMKTGLCLISTTSICTLLFAPPSEVIIGGFIAVTVIMFVLNLWVYSEGKGGL